MTLDDFRLLLDQARLAADADAIAAGQQSATSTDIASSVRTALVQAGLWSGDSDARVLVRFAQGEVTLPQLWENFVSKR